MRLRRRTEAAQRRGRIRKPRLLALLLVLLALAAASFSYGLVTAIRSELAALEPSNPKGDVDTVIYSAPNQSGQRRVLAILRGDESRVLVPSDQIAPIMKQAIVAVEDQRFYEHNGVDVRGIFRALWQDIRSQAVVEEARRSPSSTSRTPTAATTRRSPARCARPRSPGSSRSGGRRTGS